MQSDMFNLGQNGKMVVSGGTFTQVVSKDDDPFVRLEKAVSPAAFHDSGARYDPPKCYPNTRLAVLEKIRNWVRGLDTEERDALIMWLHGPAGAGKSAIVQTIAEEFSTQEEILASYFFSRTDPTRNHARSLIATIAYQISIHFPTVRSLVEDAIRVDPLILTRSLPTQMLRLVVTPLEGLVAFGYFHASKFRRLIIIDGLDECNDRDGQMDILRTIADALQHRHIPLRFLIASRSEHDLTHAFSRRSLSKISTRLALDDTYMPWDDIQVFLRGTFAEIKENHPFRTRIPADWPADEEINYLAHKSSGQFIYAATVARFVESTKHSPVRRLEIIWGVRPSGTGQQMPFGELDALYHHIFSSVENPRAVLGLLSAVILWNLPMVDKIELLLCLSPGEAELLLCDISSLAYLQSPSTEPWHMSESKFIMFYHASLGDFLLDQSRSKEFHINVPLVHAQLIEHTVRFLHDASYAGFHCPCSVFLTLASEHIHEAQPTSSLYQRLTHATLINSPTNCFDCRVLELVRFLQALQRSTIPWAEEMYKHHLQSLSNYMKQQLDIYYSDPYLTFLVISCSKVAVMPDRIQGSLLCGGTPEKVLYDQLKGLKLNFLMHSNRSDVLAILAIILSDQALLGQSAVNEERTRAAALYLLKLVQELLRRFNEWKIPSLQIQLFRAGYSEYPILRDPRRFHFPWKWRKTPLAMKPGAAVWRGSWVLAVESASRQNKRLDRPFTQDWAALLPEGAQYARLLKYAIQFLLIMLPEIDHSPQLIDFLRGAACRLILRFFERNDAKKLKKGIENYLRRVESTNVSSSSTPSLELSASA